MFVTTFSSSPMQTWKTAPNCWLRWVILFCGLAPAILNANDAIPPEKAVITLTPKFGPVTFAHQRHSDFEAVRCITCHHTMRTNGEQIRSCYDCHEVRYFSIANIRKAEPDSVDDTGPPVRNAQEAFHGLCTGCHKNRQDQNLPTGPGDSCRDCHK